LIAEKGGVPEMELYQVFNMGIGMISIVANERAQDVLNFINANGHRAWVIGEVVSGKGKSRVE
jgi:phosphoribosylformylglycinamidine cyclo-ligase